MSIGYSDQLRVLKSTSSISLEKPPFVGIYGISGSGKSWFLEKLQNHKHANGFNFEYYEGSAVIADIVPEGLPAFKALNDNDKTYWREQAIEKIQKDSNGKHVPVVMGHYMFWNQKERFGPVACTRKDLETFSHIIYLNVPPQTIWERRAKDSVRSRDYISLEQLKKWQDQEIAELRLLSREYGILFSLFSPDRYQDSPKMLAITIETSVINTERRSLSHLERTLDRAVEHCTTESCDLDTMLVFDADKTLTPVDTGHLVWEETQKLRKDINNKDYNPNEVFSSKLQYSHTAFQQVSVHEEELLLNREAEDIYCNVAKEVTFYPECLKILKGVAKQRRLGAVILTCGRAEVWIQVMKLHKLLGSVFVIGRTGMGNPIVTPTAKAKLVSRLRWQHGLDVWAFGDSPIDLEMLQKANQAVVVVGDETSRSKSMEEKLKEFLKEESFRPYQWLQPANQNIKCRLDPQRLPLFNLAMFGTVASKSRQSLRIHHATARKATKLLMSPHSRCERPRPFSQKSSRRDWEISCP